jgi:thiol-disulfide isomerase/thioredoxin
MDDILKKKNIIIFFFMNGCPYCDETKPAWEELKKHNMNKGIEFIEIEKDQIPPKMSEELQINGFPHFVKIDKKGKKKAVSGSKTTLDKLSTALFGKSGGRSRRFRRRVRKTLRHRRS